MRTKARGFRVLGLALLTGGVLFLSAGPAAADDVDEGMCLESSVAQPGDPDEGVSSGGGGVSGFDGEGGPAGPPDWCYEYSSGGAAGGGVPESTGTLDDEDTASVAQFEGCPGGGGDSGAGTSAPRPDSETADIDTPSAVPSIGSVSAFGVSSSAVAAAACPRVPLGGVGAADDIVAPNRIDAGAGAMASTAGPSAGAIMGGSALIAAAFEGLRRRRRR